MEPSGSTSLKPFVVNRLARHDVRYRKIVQQVKPRRQALDVLTEPGCVPLDFIVPDQTEKARVVRQRDTAESIGGRNARRDQIGARERSFTE